MTPTLSRVVRPYTRDMRGRVAAVHGECRACAVASWLPPLQASSGSAPGLGMGLAVAGGSCRPAGLASWLPPLLRTGAVRGAWRLLWRELSHQQRLASWLPPLCRPAPRPDTAWSGLKPRGGGPGCVLAHRARPVAPTPTDVPPVALRGV